MIVYLDAEFVLCPCDDCSEYHEGQMNIVFNTYFTCQPGYKSKVYSTVAHEVFESIPWNWVSIEQHLIKICKEYFLKLGFNLGPFKLIIKNFMVSNA